MSSLFRVTTGLQVQTLQELWAHLDTLWNSLFNAFSKHFHSALLISGRG
jgi:hypothetical protein